MPKLSGFILALLTLCPSALAATAATPDAPDGFDTEVRPFLEQHCYTCHGPDKQKAQIRYDRLTGFRPEDRHLWTLIHEQVSTGAMPPESRPRPAADDLQRALKWVESRQKLLRAGGTRRLNRRELSAALRDVTGLSVDYAQSLPDDGRVDGFDTGADGLQDAADSVAQIMQVTRQAVEGIRFLEPASAQVWTADLRDAKDGRQKFDAWKKTGGPTSSTGDTFGKPGVGLHIRPKWLGDRGGLSFRLPPFEPGAHLGVLRLKLEVSVAKYVDGLPNPHLWVDVGGQDMAYLEISNPSDQPRTIEYHVQLSNVAIDTKGLNITVTNRVEFPYSVKGFENEDKSKPEEKIPASLFRPMFDRKTVPNEQQPVPFLVLHSIEIEPDYRPVWPLAEWKLDVGQIIDTPASDSPDSARRLLAAWMERAWRRPANPDEQARFFALYEKLRGQGMAFDPALRAAFQSVLLSGSFRYLPSPGGLQASDAQHALASRLSFMLWGAPPDRKLRQLAADGKLADPKVLDAQVDRLLDDPRSEAFLRPFVTQWLEMGQPITVAMDYLQQQDFRFGRNLKDSMRDETILYVGRILADNRPAGEIVSSDWTMMNDILARHYGYDGITGGHLRKVTLRKDDPRGGGILGHAGIQSMLTWMGENWVIYRGAWALRHILDAPPPPPPLEVPELIPSDGENRGKTFKQLLVQHQQDERCSVCHKDMDPLGFAFQNFDLSGRWRSVEYERYEKNDLDGKIEWRGAGKARPVDTSGRLPRGETFDTFAEARTLLARHYTPDLVRGLMKNWVLYGTGCKADIEAMAEIRAIMAEHEAKGYPLRDLLKALVRSKTFTRN